MIIPRVDNLQETRSLKIQLRNPDFMELLPLTVVEDKVKTDWEIDGYVPEPPDQRDRTKIFMALLA